MKSIMREVVDGHPTILSRFANAFRSAKYTMSTNLPPLENNVNRNCLALNTEPLHTRTMNFHNVTIIYICDVQEDY